jgi:hypothetical protein
VSWAAHEFENYFLQRHTGLKASFLAIAVGTFLPDLLTKALVYASDDPAQFHRGWPGVGFTHSFIFGFAVAVAFLAATRSRSWAVGILVGQWAHVLTDICDTAGVMPFFPFSTENFTISMWKHAAVAGRYGDASAYYSSLGGVWDLFWFLMFVLFARNTITRGYFRNVVVAGDAAAWGWISRTLRLGEDGLLVLYRGLLFYGLGRMLSWFIYARSVAGDPFQPRWGGPDFVPASDLSDASIGEMLLSTAIGAVGFAAFLAVCWRLFVRRWWERAEDAPIVERGRGIWAVLER